MLECGSGHKSTVGYTPVTALTISKDGNKTGEKFSRTFVTHSEFIGFLTTVLYVLLCYYGYMNI